MCNCSGCCARGPQGPSETSKVYFYEETNARELATPYTSPAILAAGSMTFTITVDGTYRITALAHQNAPTEGSTIRGGIEKNGTVMGVYVDSISNGANDTITETFLKEANLVAGDVIEFVFGHTTGGSAVTNITSSLLIEKLNN